MKDGWLVENPADEPAEDRFPPAFHDLIVRDNKSDGSRAVLQCPRCGLLYEYTRTMPGGSYDAMRTWIVERLTPMMKKDKHIRKDPPKETEPRVAAPSQYRCPVCGSLDVDQTSGGSLGGEVFFGVKCNSCGAEDLLDTYQQDTWLLPRSD